MRSWLEGWLDHARELSIKQWLAMIGTSVVVGFAACDIVLGGAVSHTGTVQTRYWYVTYDRRCTATDSKGNCTSSVTVPNNHYVLVVAHHGLVEPVEVWIGQYYQYPEGSLVQISYWQGGLIGIHWFAMVSDPKQDF